MYILFKFHRKDTKPEKSIYWIPFCELLLLIDFKLLMIFEIFLVD